MFDTSRTSTTNILHMSIADYRKFAISLTLAPYFVNIHHLSDTEAYCKIKEWLIRCGKVKNLEPPVAYFDDLAMNVIERARNFQGTLKVKCAASIHG